MRGVERDGTVPHRVEQGSNVGWSHVLDGWAALTSDLSAV